MRKKMYAKKDYISLDDYSFPYMCQSNFNHNIYKTTLEQFRNLFFL